MQFITRNRTALLAAALIALPGAALAKDDVAKQANKVAAEAQDLQQAANGLDQTVANDSAARADNRDVDRHDNDGDDDDGDSGKLGLLGLIGLAGLLGLRRRDHDHDHIERRDYVATDPTLGKTTTTTRTTATDRDTRL